jgi:hypothetical protein
MHKLFKMDKTKLRYLPNVSRISIETTGVNLFALAFGVLKKERKFKISQFEKILKFNKYLSRQYKRLNLYACQRDTERYERLSNILLKHSKVYRLVMLHHASSTWYTKPSRKLFKMWNVIGGINTQNKTDLHYERWWIDKKPGDYGRPLGAPKLPWKVALLQRLQILEIYYQTTGKIQAWQHAGISYKGLVTAWTDLLLNVIDKPFIYEFDLKGFFDRVKNQDALTELPTLNKWFNEVNNVLPRKYHLPKIEEDPAMQAKDRIDKIIQGGNIATTGRTDLEIYMEMQTAEIIQLFRDKMHQEPTKEQIDYLMDQTMLMLQPGDVKTFADLVRAKETPEITESDRNLGRDASKGLGVKDQGFPQGANTSPFLSCLTLMKAVGPFKGLLMYMDDGVLYADTEKELNERIADFKTRLETIGLSMEPSKSGIVKNKEEFKGIKFLGIKMDSNRQIHSMTRKGTSRPLDLSLMDQVDFLKMAYFFNIDPEKTGAIWGEIIKGIIGLSGHMENSEERIKTWILNKSIDKRAGLDWAISKGFFSSKIAEIFDPCTNRDKKDQLIGELAKYKEIYNPKVYSGRMIDILTRRDPKYTADIQTISTEAVAKFTKDIRYLYRNDRTRSAKHMAWISGERLKGIRKA